ncbi:MAG: hypothetical protein ABMA64_09125 [Myxococcota bacterium]
MPNPDPPAAPRTVGPPTSSCGTPQDGVRGPISGPPRPEVDDEPLDGDRPEQPFDEDEDLSSDLTAVDDEEWAAAVSPWAEEVVPEDDDLEAVDDEPAGDPLEEEPFDADVDLAAAPELPVIPLSLRASIEAVEVEVVVDLGCDVCTWWGAPFEGVRPATVDVAGVSWTERVRGAAGEPARLVLNRAAVAGRFLLQP